MILPFWIIRQLTQHMCVNFINTYTCVHLMTYSFTTHTFGNFRTTHACNKTCVSFVVKPGIYSAIDELFETLNGY